MLGFSRGQIESLVNYQMRVRHCGDGFELARRRRRAPVEDGEGSWLTGADAIRALLAEVRAEELPPTAFGHASVFVQDLILCLPSFSGRLCCWKTAISPLRTSTTCIAV